MPTPSTSAPDQRRPAAVGYPERPRGAVPSLPALARNGEVQAVAHSAQRLRRADAPKTTAAPRERSVAREGTNAPTRLDKGAWHLFVGRTGGHCGGDADKLVV